MYADCHQKTQVMLASPRVNPGTEVSHIVVATYAKDTNLSINFSLVFFLCCRFIWLIVNGCQNLRAFSTHTGSPVTVSLFRAPSRWRIRARWRELRHQSIPIHSKVPLACSWEMSQRSRPFTSPNHPSQKPLLICHNKNSHKRVLLTRYYPQILVMAQWNRHRIAWNQFNSSSRRTHRTIRQLSPPRVAKLAVISLTVARVSENYI